MAVKVGVSGTTVGSVRVAGSQTQVRKIVIGTPVRKVTSGAFVISNLGGVDTTGAQQGAVLVYDESVEKFIAQKTLTETNFDGGQY